MQSPDGSAIVAPGANTAITYDTDIGVKEEKSKLFLVKSTVTISEVVRALNALGVTPPGPDGHISGPQGRRRLARNHRGDVNVRLPIATRYTL